MRDGAWEHRVSQQRAAGEAPLHEPAHVCLLMHVGAVQANTCMYQEPVSTVPSARQVRDACWSRGMSYPLTQSSLFAIFVLPNLVSAIFGGCSTRIYVDSGRFRGLVKLCGVMRWPAGLLYAPRGDVEACVGPREGHTAPEDTPQRNRPLIRLCPSVIDHKDGHVTRLDLHTALLAH
jgi:hypothetical protein